MAPARTLTAVTDCIHMSHVSIFIRLVVGFHPIVVMEYEHQNEYENKICLV